MRIIITTIDDPFKKGGSGGKQTHIRLFAKALESLGHQVSVIYPENSFYIIHFLGRKISGILNRIGKWGKGIPVQFFFYDLNMGLKTFSLLIKYKVDMIIGQDSNSIYFSRLFSKMLLRKVNIFMTVHGYSTREAVARGALTKNSISERLTFFLEKNGYKAAEAFMAVDSRIAEYLEEFSNKPKLIQFNAIDNERFIPIDDSRKIELRNKFGFEKEMAIILIPRRLVAKNGPLYPLKALRRVLRKNRMLNILFLFAGDGPEKNSLEDYINENNLSENVKLLGNVPHEIIMDYFFLSDIIVIPSITTLGVQEATSLAALEGMACNKSVIVSDVGGLKEIVKHNLTGFLVPEKNEKKLAEQILWILDNPEKSKQISLAGFEYVKNNHTYLNHAKQILDFFKSQI